MTWGAVAATAAGPLGYILCLAALSYVLCVGCATLVSVLHPDSGRRTDALKALEMLLKMVRRISR